MVSLQACFDRPHPLPLSSAPLFGRGPPRPRQGETHQLLSAAPIQNVRVLRDVANAFLHLLQHSWGASSRLSSRVSTLFQGVLNAVLHFLQLPIFPWIERHWCSDRPSATGSVVWVAVEVTAVGVSQSHKEIPPMLDLPFGQQWSGWQWQPTW